MHDIYADNPIYSQVPENQRESEFDRTNTESINLMQGEKGNTSVEDYNEGDMSTQLKDDESRVSTTDRRSIIASTRRVGVWVI